MFYSKAKNNALEEHKKAVTKYNSAFSSLEKSCKALYKERTDAVTVLEDIESLINSIANTPKELEKDITSICK